MHTCLRAAAIGRGLLQPSHSVAASRPIRSLCRAVRGLRELRWNFYGRRIRRPARKHPPQRGPQQRQRALGRDFIA